MRPTGIFVDRALLTAPHIPNLQRIVPASADDPPAIGAERNAADAVRVSLEREDFLAAVGVPSLQRVVTASADDPPAVGAECHAVNLLGVSLEREVLLEAIGESLLSFGVTTCLLCFLRSCLGELLL